MIVVDTKLIKDTLRRRGLKQTELVQMINMKYDCGMKKQYIYAILKGKSKSYKITHYICDLLDLDIREVYKNE